MTQTLHMPRVADCSATACGYNQGGCRAFAITIGGPRQSPACGTFVAATDKGGQDTNVAQVGACRRAECRHNVDLECHASQITVGPDKGRADCRTFEPR
ncbi:DUF1540 domain-containing protein [Rhizomonospora bruguierae]|uniref:DUF1540 domain-containing protein n=1 Tax=Rhizomonospora bruguierae TaxID=1581705 RepID=UPI001BCB3844|nr:DUF1540 domain-containing protein [Micromonospora sp. NBRC 107566]